jgi:hypothetical protein
VEVKNAAGVLGVQTECGFEHPVRRRHKKMYTEKHVLNENKRGIIMQIVGYLEYVSDLRTTIANWK